MYIGDNLKRVRLLAAMSQRELAAKAGVAVGSIVQWKNNRQAPHLSSLRKLSDALGVEPVELIVGPLEK